MIKYSIAVLFIMNQHVVIYAMESSKSVTQLMQRVYVNNCVYNKIVHVHNMYCGLRNK